MARLTLQGSATQVIGPTQPTMSDTITVSGGYHPTGTITFSAYAASWGDILTNLGDGFPVLRECLEAPQALYPVYTQTVNVGGDGTYGSGGTNPPFSLQGAAFYYWVATYSGDANDFPATDTACQGTGFDENQLTSVSAP
jgi:hypothetical protein